MRRVDAALATKQRAQRLVAEVGARQPQCVARSEVGRQRHLLAVQGYFRDLVGIVDLQFRLVVVQHFPQVLSREAQQHRHRRRGHLAPALRGRGACLRGGRRCRRRGGRAASRIVHHRHQLGTEAIAAMHAAQRTGERQRGRRYQLGGGARVQRRCFARRGQHEGPAAQLEMAGLAVHAPGGVRVVQLHRGFLHSQVVVVAHLRLPVLEGAVGRRAAAVEQVGIGIARGFQPGIQRRIAHRRIAGGGLLRRQRQCGLHPQFGQRRQPLLDVEVIGHQQRAAADQEVLLALRLIQARRAERLARGRAELAGVEHIGALVHQRIAGLHLLDSHHRAAAAAQQQEGGEQHRQRALPADQEESGHYCGSCSVPGTPWRITVEKWSPLPRSSARWVMRPLSCSSA